MKRPEYITGATFNPDSLTLKIYLRHHLKGILAETNQHPVVLALMAGRFDQFEVHETVDEVALIKTAENWYKKEDRQRSNKTGSVSAKHIIGLTGEAETELTFTADQADVIFQFKRDHARGPMAEPFFLDVDTSPRPGANLDQEPELV